MNWRVPELLPQNPYAARRSTAAALNHRAQSRCRGHGLCFIKWTRAGALAVFRVRSKTDNLIDFMLIERCASNCPR